MPGNVILASITTLKKIDMSHIQNCTGRPGYLYNFNRQGLLIFEENLKCKGDMPLIVYIDFETTVPTDTSLDPENRNLCAVSDVIIFAFHPDVRIKCVIIERSLGRSLQQLNGLSYLMRKQHTFITREQIQQLKDCAFSVYVKTTKINKTAISKTFGCELKNCLLKCFNVKFKSNNFELSLDAKKARN